MEPLCDNRRDEEEESAVVWEISSGKMLTCKSSDGKYIRDPQIVASFTKKRHATPQTRLNKGLLPGQTLWLSELDPKCP